MSPGREGGDPPLPSIRLQGIVVNPGDPVLVKIDGSWIPRTFQGCDSSGVWLRMDLFSTAPSQHIGPFSPEDVRPADVLGGFIREVDAGE